MQDLVPLARPYAKAIFDAAVDSGSTSETQASLKSLAAGFKEKAITDLISSPTLSRSEILKKLTSIFDGEVNELVNNLLGAPSKLFTNSFTSPSNIDVSFFRISLLERVGEEIRSVIAFSLNPAARLLRLA